MGKERNNLPPEGGAAELSSAWTELARLLASDNDSDHLLAMELSVRDLPRVLALTVVRSLAFHPNFHTRDEAAELLGSIGGEEDIFRLLLLSRDSNWVVRCSASSSLSGFDRPDVRRRLLSMAERDPAAMVRKWAVTALSDLAGDPDLGSVLERLAVRERDPFVLAAIYMSLIKLGRSEFEIRLTELRERSDLKSGRRRREMDENIRAFLAED